ncbi:MAG: biotin--[acetyl-CoA-carboxylase] ligase [Candidatus Omnitrophica bacterium]|nr:biotin--[acetyl-CoA-carboxylase] ligase [Candidatus Omnitrophota bacterium]
MTREDKLTSRDITRDLDTDFFAQTVLCYDSIDSTNDKAFRLAEQGAKEGTCVLAEHQKKGKGRLGRSWISPRGRGILLSMILRPEIAPAEVARVTLVTAVSLVKTARGFLRKRLGIKWPNDIVFQDQKVGGILTEMSAEPDRVHFVVVGVGINVNADPAALPPGALSLGQVAGKEVSRLDFTRAFLETWEKDYRRFKKGRFAELAAEWEEFSATSGRRVSAILSHRKIQGQATGIDEDGALWIRKDNGLQERVLAGDIEHLR